jgi:hypothetical protein
MGWSSWSLEALVDPAYHDSFLDEADILAMSDALRDTLQPYGYRYVNVDSRWAGPTDGYGRFLADPARFPDGMEAVADHVHANCQKFGLYTTAGLDTGVYDANPPILGTTCHARDIVLQPMARTNGWLDRWAIDWQNPCAQAYVDSVAAQWAGWGVDFVKLDGVTPGSANLTISQGVTPGTPRDNRGDVKAWAAAIAKTGRPMWLTLSWELDVAYADDFAPYANAVRATGDVECYCATMTAWLPPVFLRFFPDQSWITDTSHPGLWHDFDSMDIGVGAMDGLTLDERRTVMTLWSIAGSPLYTGDDLTRLDADGLALLTNDEVIAVNQAGHPLVPLASTLAPGSTQQVWWGREAAGSVLVGAFNLAGDEDTIPVALADLGLSGSATVHDLWTHQDAGTAAGTLALDAPSHGSRLVRLTPAP